MTVEDGLQVPQFAGERVVAEGLQVVEIRVAHAGAVEIEGDDGDPGPLGESCAEMGEETPVLEPLEAVADDERRVVRGGSVFRGEAPSAGAAVDQ